MSNVKLIWQEDLKFTVQQDNRKFMLDPAKNEGLSPKKLVLTAMAGCSGMDTAAILKKMRIEDYTLEIDVEAQSENEHPKIYKNARLIFRFTGNDLPESKVKRAVELSVDKYCPVIAMLKNSVDISAELFINDKEVEL